MVAGRPAGTSHRSGRIEAPLDHVLEEVQAALRVTIKGTTSDPIEALRASGKVTALLDLFYTCGVRLSDGETAALETVRTALDATEEVLAKQLAKGFVAYNGKEG